MPSRPPLARLAEGAALAGIAILPLPGAEILRSPHVSASDVLFLLAAAAAAGDALREGAFPRALRPDRATLAFVGWLLAAFSGAHLAGGMPREASRSGLSFAFARDFAQVAFYLGVLAPALAWILREREALHRSAMALAFASAVAIVPAIPQFLDANLDNAAVAGSFWRPAVSDPREQGNHHILGLFLAGILPALYALIPSLAPSRQKAAFSLLFLVGACVTLSFGPFLAILGATLAVSSLRGRREFRIAAVCALALFLVPSRGPRSRFGAFRESIHLFEEVRIPPGAAPAEGITVGRSGDSALQIARRYRRWMGLANLAERHALLGSGLGSVSRMKVPWGFRGDLEIPNPPQVLTRRDPCTENAYLVLAAEAGLPGLGIFLAWLLAQMKRGWRRHRGDPSPLGSGAGAAALAGILGLALAGAWCPLFVRSALPVLALLCAWARASTVDPGGAAAVESSR